MNREPEQQYMKAEEYIKKEWCDPNWDEWNGGDVIDALNEFGKLSQSSLLQELIEEIEKEIEIWGDGTGATYIKDGLRLALLKVKLKQLNNK